ncbi:MAG TPA: hypothetical protein VE398_05130 [Acidobacteriota bacterium]|nr:hypothetical protein [Acidobacteriota bacterium]
MKSVRTVCRFALPALLLMLLRAVPVPAQGDKVLAQVADGTGGDGTQYITKLRITNLGPVQDTEIKNVQVMFFLDDGTPWTIATNLGTASGFPLDLGSYQTLALNTSSAGSLKTGYAIVRNTDLQDKFAEDYQVAVTAFYEVRKGGSVIDTISVPVSQPTQSFVLPVEIDIPNNLYTGFAIVNLTNVANGVTLQLFQATTPSSAAAPSAGTTKITLGPNEHRAVFLNQQGLFPSVSSFKGMLQGVSEKPVAILALLQTPTPTGIQFATMVPAHIDSLRRNANVYLREGYSLDADLGLSDYLWNQSNITASDWEPDVTLPWDLLYEGQTGTQRRLTPQFTASDGVHDSGARFAPIGPKNVTDFDKITIQDLQALTYTANPIDMSDNSPNLPPTTGGDVAYFTFAIKTGLGRYAKVRVVEAITFSNSTDIDLVLEVFIFK